jgi:glucose/arabinose dehydrogenase
MAGTLCFAALFFGMFAGRAGAQAVPGLAATRVASGFTQPLFVTAPPNDYGRLFIVCQTGQVYILKLDTGLVNATPFLDIHARLTATNGEQGLLGLAFDPNYATNGKFYLNFTVPGGFWGQGTTHVSQFQVSGNPDVADTSNEKILLTFDHPENNHNGGWIAFSPRPNDDHNLYISTGDGGNGNDQDGGVGHIEPGGNAQNLTTLLGKILRIHIDPTAGTASIPATNPFASVGGDRGEIFCYGLRNPFRDTFDRGTGRMFINDVGQSTKEEIDVQDFSNPNGGENYEWRLREGTVSTPTIMNQPAVGGNRPPGGVDPILDYPRSTGGTTIGGVVYRGRQIPALRGTFLFGDYVAGKVFTLNYDGTAASNFQTLNTELNANTPGGFSPGSPSSFAEDANGEIYETDIASGFVNKIVPVSPNVVVDSVTQDAGTGHVLVHGYGVPFKTHKVKTTTDLSQQFGQVATVAAAGDGSFTYTDSNPGTVRFYQIAYP